MGKLLCAIACFIFGFSTAWVVVDANSKVQLRQVTSETNELLATAKKELSAKNAEIEVSRASNLELSRRAQELQRQVDQPPASVPPAVLTPAKEGNAVPEMFSPDQMKALTRNRLDGKLDSLKTRLKLTDSQVNELNAAIQRDMDSASKIKFDGKQASSTVAGPTVPGFDETLKKIMTAQQQQEYKKYQAEENSNQIEVMANAEMIQLQMSISLSEEQKDQAFEAFSRESQRQMDCQSLEEGAAKAPSALLDQWMQRKKESLRGILTPEQFVTYEKQLALQQEMAKKVLQDMKLPSSPSGK